MVSVLQENGRRKMVQSVSGDCWWQARRPKLGAISEAQVGGAGQSGTNLGVEDLVASCTLRGNGVNCSNERNECEMRRVVASSKRQCFQQQNQPCHPRIRRRVATDAGTHTPSTKRFRARVPQCGTASARQRQPKPRRCPPEKEIKQAGHIGRCAHQ